MNPDNGPASLAAAFACAVTAPAEGTMVARNGNLSLFSTFKTIYPEVSWEIALVMRCYQTGQMIATPDLFPQVCYKGSRSIDSWKNEASLGKWGESKEEVIDI